MWDKIVGRVLIAIGTGIGVGGFVVAVGAAFHYARFSALGLPAGQATAVVPREELVVTGAAFLVPAVFLGAIAVFILWMIDAVINAIPNRPNIELFNSKARRRRGVAAATRSRVLKWRWGVVAAWTALAVLGSLLYVVAVQDQGGFGDVGLRVLAVAFVALLAGAVLVATGDFWRFAFLAFGLIMVVSAASTLERTYYDPKVESAAVVFDIGSEAGKDANKTPGQGRGQAVAGLLVAQRSDYVYLGIGSRDAMRQGKGRVFSVKRDKVTDLSVGPLATPEHALARAPQLAGELCAHGAVKRRRCPRLDATVPVSVDIFPSLSRVSVTPRISLREQSEPAPTFTYRLSSPGMVTFTFEHGSKGRRVNKRCVQKPKPRPKQTEPACNRFTPIGEPLNKPARKGNNKQALPDAGDRVKLERGFYRVSIVAEDRQEQRSRPAHVHFRVVR